jgi:tRNA pseudouridine13 synthase
LIGNRFKIRIRGVDKADVGLIRERMQRISSTGLSNAFGSQRFGNYNNNHHLGKALLMEDWDRMIDLLAEGDEQLAQHVMHRRSQGAIAKPLRKLWVNALQSAIFNNVLEQRIADGTRDTPLVGDLVCKHGARGRTFCVTSEDIDSSEFQSRVASVEISPTGPMWGKKMRATTGEVFNKELAALNSFGLNQAHFATTKQYGMGVRRPLRVPVMNTKVTEGGDSEGSFVITQFELPAGSYATTLIESLLNASL